MTPSKLRRSIYAIAATSALTLVLAACGGQDDDPETTSDSSDSSETGDPGNAEGGLSGAVAADGSSTVGPLTEAAADLYKDTEPDVNVTIATSGTGGGFKVFCAGETDVSNASRAIADDEVATCESNGIEFTEIIMANDGLAVVVNPENDWAQCLTVAR